jgi:dehypoxanthine futalosine cyclase/putative menaquinone biosynthesis radical SAM enzyme
MFEACVLDERYYRKVGLYGQFRKIMRAERLSEEDGDALFACRDITAVAALAHHVRTRMHGDKTYYVRNRHINYSNICVNNCRFCAFRRDEHAPGAFTLDREAMLRRALDDDGSPFAEIHVVGGCHPHLPLARFEELFAELRRLRPETEIKAFTVAEIHNFARLERCDTRTVLMRLKKAGVSMLTGGGAEIFNPAVRDAICPGKFSGEEYLRIAGEAHALGMPSNCTMLFGHIESHADRVRHLCALRARQDESGGFVCFVPLAYQARHNPLAADVPSPHTAVDSGLDRLRTIAVARLLLDNIPHIKAYWVMLGIKCAQAALSFGADDLDGTIIEEHIGHMAGADAEQALTRAELEGMIRDCGFEPVNRTAGYKRLTDDGRVAGADAPHVCSPPAGRAHADHADVSRRPPDANREPPCLPQTPPGRPAQSPHGSRPAARRAGAAAIVRRLEKIFASPPPRKPGHDRATGPATRLSEDEAFTLYAEADLHTLGALAHTARMRLHPERTVTYVADRNINYSNICTCGCRFCAFFRPPGHADGYVLTREELARKIRETIELGGTQILLQGGLNPALPLSRLESMLSWIRDTFPSIHLHAFSPPEIAFFADQAGLSDAEVIARLVDAGLRSIPGGGAEILSDRVRAEVSPAKCSAARWLAVMKEAHRQGLRTTATMMFGHEERRSERLEHLFALRALQDKTGGFTAFIPWTFQPFPDARVGDGAAAASPFGPLRAGSGDVLRRSEPAQSYLRLLALSRLVLDNFPSLQVSWVTMGPQIAQLALFFGADDFGSLMIEENVVAAAGVSFRLSREEIHAVIRGAGFTPMQRTMDYRPVGQRENAP